MGQNESGEKATINRAETILSNLGLTWDDLSGKKVLDMGSGKSALANAAVLLGVNTKVFSIDIERQEGWLGLPQQAKEKIVQGDVENLPYAGESFDLVLDHGAMGFLGINEATRVLRLGGEFRMYPIGDQTLEYWYISYYLSEVKGQDPANIQELLQGYEQQIAEADGWIPNDYIALREEALNVLSSEQKAEVIEMLVDRYEEVTGVGPLTYKLKDPQAHEPNGVLMFRKQYEIHSRHTE